jgi:UDP-N-acetylglucosamine 2-epimerase (non-hydrolysing)
MAMQSMTLNGPVIAVCGTRPELIKTAPVIRELNRLGLPNQLILTGQHDELVVGLCEFFEITNYSILKCERKGPELNGLLSALLDALNAEFLEIQPSFVLVQGDTTSALAGAITGFHLRRPVAHIEAGLRTGNINSPFPEEANRRLISQIASLHFSPTVGATNNLLSEGVSKNTIAEVGNTIVDATEYAIDKAKGASGTPETRSYSVITIHRRESWGADITSILDAIKFLANKDESHIFKFVMHANPALQSMVRDELGGYENIELLPPLKYPDFVALISRASMILSDSGGIQEEAPTLGVPTVILRDRTERPEAIEIDACRLGTTKTETIIDVVLNWQQEIKMGKWKSSGNNPFGDGKAAIRIVKALQDFNDLSQRTGANS